MKIALDYDRTFTADPELWGLFVVMCKIQGHDVRLVTARYEDASKYEGSQYTPTNEDIEAHANEHQLPIIYCNHTAKHEHWDADIWIDDNPTSILKDVPL